MAKVQHLSRAPVVEAVIALQVRFPEPRSPECFQDIGRIIKEDYPQQEVRHQVQVQLDLAGKLDRSHAIEGFLFRNKAGTQVVQSRQLGFAFSRLAPYENWERMEAEAMRLWNIYCGELRPESLARVAVRFINRLHLPPPPIDFDDYLAAGPRLPEGELSLSAFTTSVVMPDAATKTTSIVRQVFESPTEKDVPVILDIDVIREVQLKADDSPGIQAVLRELRTVKNKLFFGSLTEKAVELFV